MAVEEAKHKKAAAAQPEICAITHEPVNIGALKNLASRREAGFRRLPGSNMTVREMIFYFLECCSRSDTYENGLEVGVLSVVWRESQCEQELGVKTRRYSGFEPFISVEGAGGGLRGRFLARLRKVSLLEVSNASLVFLSVMASFILFRRLSANLSLSSFSAFLMCAVNLMTA